MAQVDALYRRLETLPTPRAEEILAAALEHAEPPYAERIVQYLLSRSTDVAWSGLIGNFASLGSEVRTTLRREPQRWRAGLALALGAGTSRARCQALALLAEEPCPSLSYLLPDVLRDTSEEVRAAAALALRRVAEVVLEPTDQPAGEQEPSTPARGGRAEVAGAVREALRTFERHYRREVLEISLWFAGDLGDGLWQRLTRSRSRADCGHIVWTQLKTWNSPRLARFLLEALTQPAWRATAQDLLESWHRPEELVALLRETELLQQTEVTRRLATLKAPRWFDELDDNLEAVPPPLRGFVPRWLYHVGIDDSAKCALLIRWLRSSDLNLSRNAMYALVALDPPGAADHLKRVAEQDSPLAAFARQYILDQRAAPASSPALPRVTGHGRRIRAAHFDPVWHRCRSRTFAADGQLIAVLRDKLLVWRPEILERLHSRDPGDRLLALRIIGGSSHVRHFRADIEPLLNDPVDAVRRIAYAVFAAVDSGNEPGPGDAPTAPGAATPAEPAPTVAPDELRHTEDQVRKEVRQLLAELLASKCDPLTTTKLVRQLQELTRQLPAECWSLDIHTEPDPESRQ